MALRVLLAVWILLHSSEKNFAQANPSSVENFVNGICAQTLQVSKGPNGKEYRILRSHFSTNEGRVLSAVNRNVDGISKIHLSILDKQAQVSNYLLPFFPYKRVLLAGNSAWFLQENQLLEFDLATQRMVGQYSTFPKPIPIQLTTIAREFTYHRGFIYIAHGELGVSVFDVTSRKHYIVMKAGLQPGSLAAAVEIKGTDLYLLQGAFHPSGFNGLSITNMSTGNSRHVAYPDSSGVVDPYSSGMKLSDTHLFINNGGWIHVYDLKSLASGKSPMAPKWLVISENLETENGIREQFLMTEGDLLVSHREVLACSSVSYVPRDQVRRIRDWRTINKAL